MSLDPRDALRLALAPNSIAVIGASDNPNKIGGRPLAYLSRFGFKGVVYPINPTRTEVQGMHCFPDLASLPEVPDVVVVAVAGEQAIAAVDECGLAGVAVCIVMSSGFGESDPQGKARELAMAARARSRGMRIVGPNSQGLANFGNGAVPSFSTMFTEVMPADGPVGIISQSGAMSVIPYGLLRARGVGVRHSHATGNDCDVTVCELAIVVAEDPGLKLLLLYLEGIPDPWHLAEAARVARARKLPIVALKSGRSAAGQEAAQSHTGALANEDRTVDAFFAEHGIWRAQSMVDLVDTAQLYLQGWKPRGRRLVAISNSGAVCVLTADAASAADMPLEPLSDSTQGELRAILPGFATTNNPVDITAVRHRLCGSEVEARAAFTALGGTPVVVKGCTAEVSHKSELGLVRVGLRDSDAVGQAYGDMTEAARAAGVTLTGVIVAHMVRGQRELMIGARLDPVFGPVVLVGDGGKYVEAMPDVQVLLAPFDTAQVEQALRRLRIAPLLDGVRGEPALDVEAFCRMAVAVGALMVDDAAGITQLDINPVIVGARGTGCVAVDAVVYREITLPTPPPKES